MKKKNLEKNSSKESLKYAKTTLSWNENYLDNVKNNIETILQDIYEKEFIENIFNEFDSTITRKNFIMAIEAQGGLLEGVEFDIDLNPFDGDGFDMGMHKTGKSSSCKWLFRPSQIRLIFKKYIH